MSDATRVIDLAPTHAIAIRARMPMSDLAAFFDGAFGELAIFARDHGVTCVGMPFARYFSVAPEEVDVEAAMPVAAPVAGEGRVHEVELPAERAVELRHVGPYWTLTKTYAQLEAWLAGHHAARAGAAREVYVNGPAGVEPEEWVTLVQQPFAPQDAGPS